MPKNTSLQEVLQNLFDNNVSFKIEGSYIVLSPAGATGSPQQATHTVKGVVEDALGPIAGANVVEKGTTNGTITDMDGRYSLMNVPESATLTISYIGYKTVSLSAKDKNTAKITLTEDSKMIDEVVVVGYGVQRKRDVSTSISSVKAEQIAEVSASDFRQALAGKMPGVQVTQPSGDPEGSVSIRVRGISTVKCGSDPLYIIDGVPVERWLCQSE